MGATSELKVGRTGGGFRIRVEGRGTLRESPAVGDFAARALADGTGSLVVELSACDYLDSTFLGCLVSLHKRFGHDQPPRFAVAASPEVSRRLLGANHLDRFLNVVDEGPKVVGEDISLPAAAPAGVDLGHHVLECHRRLAEAGGPNREAFGRVADQLSLELKGPEPRDLGRGGRG